MKNGKGMYPTTALGNRAVHKQLVTRAALFSRTVYACVM